MATQTVSRRFALLLLCTSVFFACTGATPVGAVEATRPTLEVSPATPLADRAVVTVAGRGFAPSTSVSLTECAWTDTVQCFDGALAYAFVDVNGELSVQMPVLRTVQGVDCADRASRCRIWAVSYEHPEEIATAALTFDPKSPTITPSALVAPSKMLRDGQVVTVSGRDFLANSYLYMEQCVRAGTPNEACRYLTEVVTDETGGFQSDVPLTRRVGFDDCGEAACVVRVNGYPFDRVAVPVGFDTSVPPPPDPTLTVAPDTGLVDWQVVEVALHDFEVGTSVQLHLCEAGGTACRGAMSVTVNSVAERVSMAVPRMVTPGRDCAVVPCVVRATLFGSSGEASVEAAVHFDPAAPLAGGERVVVVPNAGLWDAQHVEVRGQRFEPGGFTRVQQCTDAEGTSCVESREFVPVDPVGRFAERVTVQRTLATPSKTQDCAVVTCYLVVDDDPAVAVALAFDPNGPTERSDLPPQLPCVAWPTDGWPVGPVPDGVDPAEVERAGAEIVGRGGADSVVVIHGGRLVYEKYAQGVDAGTIEPSFSMSKSFTSTVIGLLVDDGKLALDARAPVDEWSAPDDPRRAITLRHLLNMSSGLQWNEDYSGPSDVISMVVAPDASAYAVARPLQFPPGTFFNYSTGDTQVLGKIIGETAHVSGDAYATYLHDRLFDPLGITPVVPGFDQAGTWNAGWKTDTTTRNFAKLGLLYLRDGVWEDEPLLASDWVDFVRTPSPAYSGYGGQFWLDGDGGFSMIGLYGQSVHILPALDLIVAVNNGSGDSAMVNAFANAAPATCGAPPSAHDDDATVTALGQVDIDVLANDDGGEIGLGPSTLTVTQAPAHGHVAIDDGRLRYRSDAGFVGTDTVAYAVCTNDRRICVEAQVSVAVEPLPFAFRVPHGPGVHQRAPGHAIHVSFETAADAVALAGIASVPVDCASGTALGMSEPVETEVHVQQRSGTASFSWRTERAWTGCRDLVVTLADGVAHHAHFRWRTRG